MKNSVTFWVMFSSVRYIENCGAYIVGGETDGVTLYGILHVTTYEDDLLITDDDIDITIDEDALPYTFTNLGVCHMAMNGALIRDCDEFYPHNVLIDVETGEVLHDFADSFGDEIIFGDYIIDADRIRDTVQIYDYDGELDSDCSDATGILLNDYRYAIAFDGYLSGRFSSGWGDNIIFVSFSRDTITNVMNGAVMAVNDDCFYSHERDYIFADDISNGNLSEHHWYLYDNEFILLLTGDDYGDVLYDAFTDDMYVSEYSDGVTTIYSLDTYEPVLEVEGRFSIRIMNGEILLTGTDEVMLFDNSGEQLFSSAVSH